MMRYVSFVVPAYNEEKLIAKCVKSIMMDAMNTRDLTFEIIVVDNGSTDQTANAALKAGAYVAFEERKGIVWARAAGSKHAKHPIHACIDADNTIPVGWTARMLREIEKPGVVAVSGPLLFEDQSQTVKAVSRAFFEMARFAHNYIGPMLQGGNYAFWHWALLEGGGYDTSVEFYGEDTRTAQILATQGIVNYCMGLRANASDRRLVNQGRVATTALYVANYIFVSFLKLPLTKQHVDYRK